MAGLILVQYCAPGKTRHSCFAQSVRLLGQMEGRRVSLLTRFEHAGAMLCDSTAGGLDESTREPVMPSLEAAVNIGAKMRASLVKLRAAAAEQSERPQWLFAVSALTLGPRLRSRGLP